VIQLCRMLRLSCINVLEDSALFDKAAERLRSQCVVCADCHVVCGGAVLYTVECHRLHSWGATVVVRDRPTLASAIEEDVLPKWSGVFRPRLALDGIGGESGERLSRCVTEGCPVVRWAKRSPAQLTKMPRPTDKNAPRARSAQLRRARHRHTRWWRAAGLSSQQRCTARRCTGHRSGCCAASAAAATADGAAVGPGEPAHVRSGPLGLRARWGRVRQDALRPQRAREFRQAPPGPARAGLLRLTSPQTGCPPRMQSGTPVLSPARETDHRPLPVPMVLLTAGVKTAGGSWRRGGGTRRGVRVSPAGARAIAVLAACTATW
jgi:hypothetical protein